MINGKIFWEYEVLGPRVWRHTEDKLKELASEVLWRNQKIDSTNILITAEGEGLHLHGYVNTLEAKTLAEICVAKVPGVKSVENYLEVSSNLRFSP